MGEKPLTHKQALFVEYYLGEARGNATQAARMAGYTGTDHALQQRGYELLKKSEVLTRIRARVREVGMTTDEILLELWRVAMAPTAAFMVQTRAATYDTDGTLLEPMQTRLDYAAKVRALELLMKYNGMFDRKAQGEPVVKALIGVDISRI
jgi:phage terminase small subunit